MLTSRVVQIARCCLIVIIVLIMMMMMIMMIIIMMMVIVKMMMLLQIGMIEAGFSATKRIRFGNAIEHALKYGDGLVGRRVGPHGQY